MKRVIHLAQRPRRHFTAFLVAVSILAFLLSSCAGTKGQREAERYYKEYSKTHPTNKDTTRTRLRHVTSPPAPLPQGEGVAKPGIFSGIGQLFSTPEGVAHRRAVRLAEASAPKIGKKAQGAIIGGTGNHVELKQAQAAKNAGPATNADSGAVVTNTDIDKNKAPVAAGPNATATQTVEKPGFWAVMGAAALRLWWLWLLILLFLFRKRLPVVGPFFA